MQVRLIKEEKIISEFLASIGLWRKYIVIGGGYAPIIYKLYFETRPTGNLPVGTLDIDSLIPRKIPLISTKDIARHLKESGFEHVYKNNEIPATEAYVKQIDGEEIEIEFLTDDSTRGDKNRNVMVAGVVAQPLSYLKLSLKKTLEFKTRSGEVGNVVSPGAWIFHKGLTFPRRKDGLKYYKDLYGIWYVASQIGEFSYSAIEDLKKLRKENPQWSKTFSRNLRKWVQEASPANWRRLESQDPFGGIKRGHFEKLVAEIS